jgi:hypothetical protein
VGRDTFGVEFGADSHPPHPFLLLNENGLELEDRRHRYPFVTHLNFNVTLKFSLFPFERIYQAFIDQHLFYLLPAQVQEEGEVNWDGKIGEFNLQ